MTSFKPTMMNKLTNLIRLHEKKSRVCNTGDLFFIKGIFFYIISEVGCGLLHVIYISIISYCYNLKWPRKHNGLRYTLKMWGVQNRKRRPLGLSPQSGTDSAACHRAHKRLSSCTIEKHSQNMY